MSTSIGLNYRSPCPQGQGHPDHRVWTLKNHPATKRGGQEVKGTVQGPPLCLHRSDVSTSPQRLWPGAQWTITVQGPKGKVSGVRRRGANRATKEGKASGRSDRHCHLPSASGEARGPCELQEEPVDELRENKYP